MRILAVGVAVLVSIGPAAARARGHGGGHSGPSSSTASGSHTGSQRGHRTSHPSFRAGGTTRSGHAGAGSHHAFAGERTGSHHMKSKRDPAQRAAFMRHHPCPGSGKTHGACPGYVVDHVVPLKRGGADAPSNMQWQTRAEAKAKDRRE